MLTLFCVKRLIYGFTTSYCGNYVVPNIYVYIFIPLFSIGYLINNKPMNSKLLNFMEIMNEFLILCCGYFIMFFTQWICDPNLRYNIGFIYIPILASVLLVNFILIFYEMSRAMKKANRKRKWTN